MPNEILYIIVLGLVVIILVMGISYIAQSLEMSYYTDTDRSSNYYKNPLNLHNSKYFHYRPKGTVILSQSEWRIIEKNIGVEISKAKTVGKRLGYKDALQDFQQVIDGKREKSAFNPLKFAGITDSTPQDEATRKLEYLAKMFDPKNFVDLDRAFVELAELRSKQIKRVLKNG